jgi:hypothetical protein
MADFALPHNRSKSGGLLIEQAKAEISRTWEKARTNGLEFGKTCAKWEKELGIDEILGLYKKLAIKPSDARWWIDRYKESTGLKKAQPERRQHRDDPDNFEDLRVLALEMIRLGFKELENAEPKNLRQLRNAKDWAMAKLQSKLL